MNRTMSFPARSSAWGRKTGAVLLFVCLGLVIELQGRTAPVHLDTGEAFSSADDPALFTMRIVHSLRSRWVVDPFKRIPYPSPFSIDSVKVSRGIFRIEHMDKEEWAEVTEDWSVISFYESVGGQFLKFPFSAPVEWYLPRLIARERLATFYAVKSKASADTEKKARGKSIEVFGAETAAGRVSLNVRGNVRLMGKMVFQDQALVRNSFRESQTTHLEFDQQQSLNVEGKIGDRVSVLMDRDSEREFDWENNIRIHYAGTEDEIIQKVEAGNISLSLPSTQFVTFSGKNSGLFGLKSIMKIGPVDITSIASIEQTKKEKQKFTGGAETQGQTIPDYQFRKDQYFFVDSVFRNGGVFFNDDTTSYAPVPSFYPLVNGKHVIYPDGVVIKEIEVYKSVGSNTGAGVFPGVAYIDPVRDTANGDTLWRESDPVNAELSAPSFFRRLVWQEDYTASEDLGYIRLSSPVQSYEILAVSYTLSRRGESEVFRSIGQLSTEVQEGDSIRLKLIKPLTPSPTHPTWPLMFKNVYYLGAMGIRPDGFEVKIVNKRGSLGNNEWDDNGNTFIHLFGLDDFDENANPVPDDIIDKLNPNIVNLRTGELLFPMLHPFEIDARANTENYFGEGNQRGELESILPDSALMYHSTNSHDISAQNTFDIQASYTNKSSTINLGGFMLVEGSEQVFLNNVQLQRGVDYSIDYFTGTVTFLTDAINEPGADLEILYDKHELVSFDKKTIVGARAQMDLGPNSFIGGTALYYNQSVINEKIEVGYEPTRNFIWDVNGRYEQDMDFVTRAIDKLPLIETNKKSSFRIEGELARVLPNPNPTAATIKGDPSGVAFIDDFEGAKRTTSLPIRHRFWYRSSTPVGMSSRNRANMFWYNPYAQVPTREIWPDQETSIRARNELTDILVLNFKRRQQQLDDPLADDYLPGEMKGLALNAMWAGITTSFYSGDYNQSQNKFLEIWLKTGTQTGRMIVDLGFISEDQNGNGVFDTEDQPEEGLDFGNTLLEDDEDIGLDGCQDAYEDGYGGCLDTLTYQEAYDLGLFDLIYVAADLDPNDPNGDNWYYTEGSNDYTHIDGTEGNGTADRPLEGARYPDTEDINRDGIFDSRSDYFTVSFELSKFSSDWERFKGGFTSTGWRLYRIPLSEFRKVKEDGNITWDTIKFMRLVLTDIEDQAVVQIAKVELVGNEWQELGVRPSNSSQEYVTDDSAFVVAVVNNEDNDDYTMPPGVTREKDIINDLFMKEQSLVLKFTNLEPNHEGAALKNFELRGDRAQSLLAYKTMKLYTYGQNKEGEPAHIWEDSSHVEFFIRFGHFDDFYEISQPVYIEWDEQRGRNALTIDLDFLTELKRKQFSSARVLAKGSANTDSIFVDTTAGIIFEQDAGGDIIFQQDGRRFRIRGNPAISRVKYFVVGIRNTCSDSPISGEVWIDELRLSGVRKDVGTALRVQSSISLADLGSATISYNRTDADFHVLQQRLGSGKTAEKFRFDGRFNINKLFPQSWGLSVPLSMSYSENLTTPKYEPGTDMLLDTQGETGSRQIPLMSLGKNDPADSLLVISKQVSLSTSFSKSAKSDRWFTKYSIDRLKVNFSGSHSWMSNEQKKEEFSKNYNGGASYNLSFGRDNYVSPFRVLKWIPWLGKKISDAHLYYTPSSIDMSLNASETLNETTKRVGDFKSVYNLGLSRTFKAGYKIFDNLNASYSKTIKSDMDDFRARYLEAIKKLKPGVVTAVTENLSSTFTPKLFSWLKPSLSYSGNYRWSKPTENTLEGSTITSQTRISSSLSLSPKSIIESVYTPPRPKRGTSTRRRAGRTKPADQEEAKSKQKTPQDEGLRKILQLLYQVSSKVNPISITYSESRSENSFGVIEIAHGDTVPGRASIGYRFGFRSDLGLDFSDEWGVDRGSLNHQRDLSLRSGLNLSRQISMTFSFADNRSWGEDGNDVHTASQTRDFLRLGEKGFPFPGWSLRWSGVEKWPILNAVATSASLEHAFAGKQSGSWKSTEKENTISWEYDENKTDQLRSAKYSASFSPLVGLSMTMVKGITLSTRYSHTQNVDKIYGGISSTTIKIDRTWSASSNYSHRGGLRIPIFFFKDFNLENTVNFTLSFDYSSSETKESNVQGVKPKTTGWQKSWKISPRISYSFTKRVTGGIWYQYRESDSNTVGQKIDRDFGFDVNIAIQG